MQRTRLLLPTLKLKLELHYLQIILDYSFQSDDGTSHCSSVESVLELRKPDPEEVLLELGFGPRKNSEKINRIPARFLQPSKLLPHIDINQFLEDYGSRGSESNSIPPSPSRTRARSN
ncbi:protein ITPRID2 [Diorhabda sublineata]|uniref:protein ITPRID2 n=2 Tax=Diorhabda TaxID=217246 RepID=UPI0024E1575A|nr:protein ITPRID2 [Diorhabda sublineata]